MLPKTCNTVALVIMLTLATALTAVSCDQPPLRVADLGSGPSSTEEPPAQPAIEPAYAAQIAEQRDPAIPSLPFPDNPDPTQCGIPIQWGDENKTGYLSGLYDGVLIQPDVLLYDSHLRLGIEGQAPHGSQVEIVLYQQNPVIDYYLVKVKDAGSPTEGWVPSPFLSFDPVN